MEHSKAIDADFTVRDDEILEIWIKIVNQKTIFEVHKIYELQRKNLMLNETNLTLLFDYNYW